MGQACGDHAGMAIRAGTLLSTWILAGLPLVALEIVAWACPGQVMGVLGTVQNWYGTDPNPAWYVRSDTHLHAISACLGTLWLGLGCRLFLPRGLPLVPLLLMGALALSDEVVQIGSVSRSFDWTDQIGDGVGMLLAVPGLLLLRRLVVRPAERAAAARRPGA